MRIVLQLVMYCALFTLMVKLGVGNSALNGLFFYPKPVQEKVYALGLTDREMVGRKRKRFMTVFFAGMAAALRAADRNPYSWNMDYLPYPDGSGYEARFTKCGICTLMKELGLFELTPAMCHLDYTMNEAGGASEFVRQYTLASGGLYCDCGYKKKK